MVVLLFIYKYILKFVYVFLKMFKTKNRVLFLSRQSNTPSIDFTYLINEIKTQYPEYEIKVLTKRMEKNNPKQIISYMFHPFVQMFYLATSKICFTDGYQITISCLKHKSELKIIQLWHSLVAIKKFGYQCLNTKKEKQIAKIMCMHKNYDMIVCSSNITKEYYKQSFNCDNSKFIDFTLPRVDYLLESFEVNKEKVYNIYPELMGKKIILYAPTFRISNNYKFDEIIKAFDSKEYILIIKKHPRTKVEIDSKYTFSNINTLETLSIADYIITDYSGISVEAAILSKNVYLYDYDEEEYKNKEGINIDLSEYLNEYKFNNIKDVKKSIDTNKYDKEKLKIFEKSFVNISDKTATKQLVEYILGGKNEK